MIKNVFLILVIFVSFNMGGCQDTTVFGDTIISNNPDKRKLEVMYFHITDRCQACYQIEENLRATMFRYFKKQMKKGEIDLYILNCELQENQDLVLKYDAFGSALVLTPYYQGTELETEDISAWSFQMSGNKDLFVKELREMIKTHLKYKPDKN